MSLMAGVEVSVWDGDGRQTMNVNLSGSWRQLCCMAYSSSIERGSEAVASWIS